MRFGWIGKSAGQSVLLFLIGILTEIPIYSPNQADGRNRLIECHKAKSSKALFKRKLPTGFRHEHQWYVYPKRLADCLLFFDLERIKGRTPQSCERLCSEIFNDPFSKDIVTTSAIIFNWCSFFLLLSFLFTNL